MVLNVVFLFTEPVTEPFVLLHGPVPECLRLVHGKELPVSKGWNSRLPTWEPQVTIARNCRFPELGTPGSQPGNHGLPLQATAGYQSFLGTQGTGSQTLKLTVPNVGTRGYPRNCRFLEVRIFVFEAKQLSL